MSAVRRMHNDISLLAPARSRLRVIQLGYYPRRNRGARSNLLGIHDRLLTRGYDSTVIDLTRNERNAPQHHCPRSAWETIQLVLRTPADIVHLHLDGEIGPKKWVLAAILKLRPKLKTVCSLHLGGHPKRRIGEGSFGLAGVILRRFDALIGINPEAAGFFERVGVDSKSVHLITPFPRLRQAKRLSLPGGLEDFCRLHMPLLVSVGALDPGCNLTLQFDVLSEVRARYPTAGLIAIGGGSQLFKLMYQRAMHRTASHIELTGAIPELAAEELIRRASILLHTSELDLRALPPETAVVVGTRNADEMATRVVKTLEQGRPAQEYLVDGIDDVIRLYEQLSGLPSPPRAPAIHDHQWPVEPVKPIKTDGKKTRSRGAAKRSVA